MATEENMFLRQLCTSPLQQTVQKHIAMNKEGQQKRDDMKEECLRKSSSIFRRDLDKPLWAKLAVDAKLLPASSMEHQHEKTERGSPVFDYESPPCFFRGSERLVKGTSLKFQSNSEGGPCTKYEALFDSRPQFDYMRIGFLSEIGGWNLQILEERVHELASIAAFKHRFE